jgi:hypothetical protein
MNNIPGIPELFISARLTLNGEIIYDMPMRKAHSWLRNALNQYIYQWCTPNIVTTTWGDGYINQRYASGAYAGGIGDFDCNGVVANDEHGIILGTGTDTESFDTYIMAGRVLHGTGAGQMSYAATTLSVTWNKGIATATNQRYFNNNSAGNIVVSEICLGGHRTSGLVFLISRDLLDSAITVTPTSQLSVTYQNSFDCNP